MSYILAMKILGCVYLFADGAVTHQVLDPSSIERPEHTAFGERTFVEQSGVVTDGLLKLVNFGDTAIAFCGSVVRARLVLSKFRELRSHGLNPREAIEAAVREYPKIHPHQEMTLFVTFFENERQRLLSYNQSPDGTHADQWQEHDDNSGNDDNATGGTGFCLLQSGSAPPFHNFMSAAMIKEIAQCARFPRLCKALILSVLQSYGTHDYLMARRWGIVHRDSR
jgi:hypothetical protein